MKTYAVIPTKYVNVKTLSDLIVALASDSTVDSIFIMNNKDGVVTTELWPGNPKIQVMGSFGLTIYQMWNYAWRYLRENNPKDQLNIAFLNDDIEIFPEYSSGEYLGIMAAFLRADEYLGAVYPDYDKTNEPFYSIKYTEGTSAGAGGMSGYAFMLKGELDIPYVDEAFQLYWGDDDLVKQIFRAGYKIGRVMGLPIEHAGSQTIKTINEQKRWELMERDRQYFNKKYGENRGPVF